MVAPALQGLQRSGQCGRWNVAGARCLLLAACVARCLMRAACSLLATCYPLLMPTASQAGASCTVRRLRANACARSSLPAARSLCRLALCLGARHGLAGVANDAQRDRWRLQGAMAGRRAAHHLPHHAVRWRGERCLLPAACIACCLLPVARCPLHVAHRFAR